MDVPVKITHFKEPPSSMQKILPKGDEDAKNEAFMIQDAAMTLRKLNSRPIQRRQKHFVERLLAEDGDNFGGQ